MKRSIASLLLLAFLTFTVNAGSLKAPTGFDGQLWRSTMILYAIDDGAHVDCTIQPYEKIPGGYNLLTAGHCVQKIPASVKFAVADDIGGKLTPVTLIKAYEGDGFDFATFEMKTNKEYPVMQLGDEHTARIGDAVINPNFSLGFGKQLSFGRISSDSLVEGRRCGVADCVGNFLVQIDGAAGASGSVIIAKKTHKVIGMMVMAWADAENSQIGMFVEPISAFKTFLLAPAQPHPAPKTEVVTPFEIIIQ